MGVKTPPYAPYPAITQAAFKALIVAALRAKSMYWKPAMLAMELACIGSKVNKKTGKKAKHYRCAKCRNTFVAADVVKDHKLPVIDPEIGFVSWDVYIERMFCGVDGFQILCKQCHDKKTSEEKLVKKLSIKNKK